MTQTHPITPPEDLLEQWYWTGKSGNWQNALTLAYRAGADQELEACYGWVEGSISTPEAAELRAARRPKPPSLKEQALKGLKEVGDFTLGQLEGCSDFNEFKTHVDNIHRALEALPND
jgi:hypothetical protein